MKFKKSITILYSADIRRSIAYYTERLGFEQQWEWDDPPSFAGVEKDEVEVFFSKVTGAIPEIWFCIVVDNIDDYYNSMKDKGADIRSLPETKPWGMREMIIRDPDGHMIRIGHNTRCD